MAISLILHTSTGHKEYTYSIGVVKENSLLELQIILF